MTTNDHSAPTTTRSRAFVPARLPLGDRDRRVPDRRGSVADDGRGASIWDTFSHHPGADWNGGHRRHRV